jgi:deoxyribodipyrimidine photo-lyase
VSGRGTDPRVGRRFNPAKQTQDHDAQGRFRQVWLA